MAARALRIPLYVRRDALAIVLRADAQVAWLGVHLLLPVTLGAPLILAIDALLMGSAPDNLLARILPPQVCNVDAARSMRCRQTDSFVDTQPRTVDDVPSDSRSTLASPSILSLVLERLTHMGRKVAFTVWPCTSHASRVVACLIGHLHPQAPLKSICSLC